MRPALLRSGALAATMLSAVLVVGATAAAARPTAAPIPPASGHAQVIAQGVAAFAAGPHHWRLTSNDVGTAPVGIETAAPTFFVAAVGAPAAGGVRIDDADGLGWLLADGEGAFGPADSSVQIDPAPGAVVHEIAVDEGTGDDAFDPGDGFRDLDLVRDVLATGEALTVRSDVSVLIFVTAGVITAADGSEIAAGTTRAVVGEISVTNNRPEPAVLLAAIVGPVVGAPPTDAAPQDDGPAPTQAPATTAAPASPPTTIDPTLDTDGDGLTDVEEIELYGTDPTTYDTDGDTVSDYLEAKDGYSDPFNPDTDGDGFDDSEQFDGYDPRDPNSYPGAPSPSTSVPPSGPPASTTPAVSTP